MHAFPTGLTAMTGTADLLAPSTDTTATATPTEGKPVSGKPAKGKLFIKTHGCQMNEYDSDKMAAVLGAEHGLEITLDESEADEILINTCSIREKAQENGRAPSRGRVCECGKVSVGDAL